MICRIDQVLEFDDSHYVSWVPEDRVGVEVFGGIKPKVELHLPVPHPLSEYIGVERIRICTEVAKELKVNLIMSWSL